MSYRMSKFIIKYFERYISQNLPDDPKGLTEKAQPIFDRLMREAPDMGKNMMASNMDLTVAFFAYYEASRHRIGGEAIVTLIQQLADDYAWITFLTDMNRHRYVRRLYYKMYSKHAAEVEKHKAIGEWTGTWSLDINPDNREEGIYYHMSNCPLYAFVKAHGYDDLMPYICKFDFIFERFLHARLIRTQTEATGGDYCDYWFVPDKSETAEKYKDFVSV